MTNVSEALNAATSLRAAIPGRPEDGPYPATTGEVADEVATWVGRFQHDQNAPDFPAEVIRALADYLPRPVPTSANRPTWKHTNDLTVPSTLHIEPSFKDELGEVFLRIAQDDKALGIWLSAGEWAACKAAGDAAVQWAEDYDPDTDQPEGEITAEAESEAGR